MDILILLLFLVSIVHTILSTCPEHVFLPCLLRLKAQRVPMERNMLSVVFSIGTEARLLHTCKVYSSTLPCFREKILECGDDKQRRMLNDVGKMLMFLCSPFSLQQQRSVIRHQECISSIIQMPSALQCQLNSFPEGRQVLQCKKNCAGRNSDFICLMRTWISEQNICTLKDINDKCGADAAALYRELQQTVFEPMFPIICEYDIPEATSPPPTTLATKPTKSSTISAKTKAPTKTKPDEYHKIVTTKETNIMNITSPPLILSSPTVNRTTYPVIARPKNVTKTKKVKSTMKPKKITSAPSTSTTASMTMQPVMVSFQQTAPTTLDNEEEEEVRTTIMTERPMVWTRRPASGRLVKGEVWHQVKHPDRVTERYYPFVTEHPLFSTTLEGQTPRSHRVIDIIRSLLPENLPERLTSLLDNAGLSQALANFTDTNMYHTPPSAYDAQNAVTDNPNFKANSMNSFGSLHPRMIPAMNPNPAFTSFHSFPKKFKPNPYSSIESSVKKWKPWYHGGSDSKR